jgi:hypothetical protein
MAAKRYVQVVSRIVEFKNLNYNMELENIIKNIHQKIQNQTKEYFPLERDFDEQMGEIREHYLTALETHIKAKNGTSQLDMNPGSSFGIGSEKLRKIVRNKFNQTFKKTDGWLYTNLNDKNHLYYHLISTDWKNELVRNDPFYCLKKQWATIDKAIKYLKSEELNKVRKCFVNLVDINSYSNSYSLSHSHSFNSNFTLLIYLITSERIITTLLNKDKVILSTEHIIKKDLKKVEIKNETKVEFHYHGLHDPDILHLDSYELAIEVRKEVTELRESKFTNSNSKH